MGDGTKVEHWDGPIPVLVYAWMRAESFPSAWVHESRWMPKHSPALPFGDARQVVHSPIQDLTDGKHSRRLAVWRVQAGRGFVVRRVGEPKSVHGGPRRTPSCLHRDAQTNTSPNRFATQPRGLGAYRTHYDHPAFAFDTERTTCSLAVPLQLVPLTVFSRRRLPTPGQRFTDNGVPLHFQVSPDTRGCLFQIAGDGRQSGKRRRHATFGCISCTLERKVPRPPRLAPTRVQ